MLLGFISQTEAFPTHVLSEVAVITEKILAVKNGQLVPEASKMTTVAAPAEIAPDGVPEGPGATAAATADLLVVFTDQGRPEVPVGMAVASAEVSVEIFGQRGAEVPVEMAHLAPLGRG